MKVLCIDDDFFSRIYNVKMINCPKFGEPVTVIGVRENGYYFLQEYPINDFGDLCAWNPKKFIPISEIDETEFVREFNKEKV